MSQLALICPYDGTSRQAGAASGAYLLWEKLFADAFNQARYDAAIVRLESRNSAMYCKRLFKVIQESSCRLLLGGEHLVTFPFVESLAQRYEGLKLVVFDAHHDAYPYPLLNHYTVFHHIATELRVEVLVVGVRYELEDCCSEVAVITSTEAKSMGRAPLLKAIRDFVGGSPFHLSLDLDVLDPEEFPAVSAPVQGGLSVEELTGFFQDVLELSPLSVDMVEYNPGKDCGEFSALRQLRPIASKTMDWLSTCFPSQE